MLYLIGLGLGDAKDITIKGLEIVKSAHKVFLEAYTSILKGGKEELENFYGRELTLADRNLVEQGADEILDQAEVNDVAFLVVGDPFGATTHTDLIIRAKDRNICYKVIHNASILNAVGCCGLQLYNFGETVSIVMWQGDWQPDSFYNKIIANKERNLHTLCLLDIKVKEQSIENMMRGREIFEPPRYLTANEAVNQLLEIANKRRLNKNDEKQELGENSFCVALARVGWEDQKIVFGTMEEVSKIDLGPPIHSLIIPGQIHFIENEMLQLFSINQLQKMQNK